MSFHWTMRRRESRFGLRRRPDPQQGWLLHLDGSCACPNEVDLSPNTGLTLTDSLGLDRTRSVSIGLDQDVVEAACILANARSWPQADAQKLEGRRSLPFGGAASLPCPLGVLLASRSVHGPDAAFLPPRRRIPGAARNASKSRPKRHGAVKTRVLPRNKIAFSFPFRVGTDYLFMGQAPARGHVQGPFCP